MILFWNKRGFMARGRWNQLRNYAHVSNWCYLPSRDHRNSFSSSVLSSIEGSGRFIWKWLLASGHSGGILIVAKLDVLYFVAFDFGNYFASMVLCQRDLNCCWKIIVIYGPADHTFSHVFWMSSLWKFLLYPFKSLLGVTSIFFAPLPTRITWTFPGSLWFL